MSSLETRKYSLWISPHGSGAVDLQRLVDELAETHDAPSFTPHITIVGCSMVSDERLELEKARVNTLAGSIGRFSVKLAEYGYQDETHRSLYMLARSSELESLYDRAALLYPQVQSEHFQAMPHMSVLYGSYDESLKRGIIAGHPITPLNIGVATLDLHFTDGPEDEWHKVYSVPLGV